MRWSSPTGPLDLLRWPPRTDDDLQAWDGADTYLIEELEGCARVLVVDDAFGALSCALGDRAVGWGDSETARLAIEANSKRNGLPAQPWHPFTQVPPTANAAVVRLPRSLRRLRWILARLGPALEPGAPVLLGARSKDVQKSAVAATEAAIGPARSTLARHRARLIVAERDGRTAPEPPERTWEAVSGVVVRAYPGVFGEERMDGGAAKLLEHVGAWDGRDIVDLGCGTGALGLAAAADNPAARVLFTDASHLAVASARRSFEAAELQGEARFEVQDVLAGEPDESADVVLCNPPFHQGRTLSRRVAAHMFAESARVLRRSGRLLVVGNRHLGYHVGLKRHFGSVEVVGSDRRFVVLQAEAPLKPSPERP